MKCFQVYFAALVVLSCLSLAPADSAPREFSIGTEEASDFRPAEAIAAPQPAIPHEMHDHCFKSCCIARFLIHPDGKASVKLLTSSGDDDLDEVTVRTLRRWRFRPASLNGVPVESTRRVKIEFAVE